MLIFLKEKTLSLAVVSNPGKISSILNFSAAFIN